MENCKKTCGLCGPPPLPSPSPLPPPPLPPSPPPPPPSPPPPPAPPLGEEDRASIFGVALDGYYTGCVIDVHATDEASLPSKPYTWLAEGFNDDCMSRTNEETNTTYTEQECIDLWSPLPGINGERDLTQRWRAADVVYDESRPRLDWSGEERGDSVYDKWDNSYWAMSVPGLAAYTRAGFFEAELHAPAHTIEPVAQMHPTPNRRKFLVTHDSVQRKREDCYDANNLQVTVCPLAARTEPFKPGEITRVTISPVSAVQVEMERDLVLMGGLGDVPRHMRMSRWANVGLIHDAFYRAENLFPQLGGASLRSKIIDWTNRALGLPVANRGRDHNLYDPLAVLLSPEATAEQRSEAAAAYRMSQQIHMMSTFLYVIISPKDGAELEDKEIVIGPGDFCQVVYRGMARALREWAERQIVAEAEGERRRSLAEDAPAQFDFNLENTKAVIKTALATAKSKSEFFDTNHTDAMVETLAGGFTPLLATVNNIDFENGGEEAVLLVARYSDVAVEGVGKNIGLVIEGHVSEEEWKEWTSDEWVGIYLEETPQKVLQVPRAGEDTTDALVSRPPPPPSPPVPPPPLEPFPPPAPPPPPPPPTPPPALAAPAVAAASAEDGEGSELTLAVALPAVAVVAAALSVLLYFRRRSARAVEGDEDDFLAGGDEENTGAVSGDMLRKYNPTYNPTRGA